MRRKKYDIGIVVAEARSQATNSQRPFQTTTRDCFRQTLSLGREIDIMIVALIHTLREESQSPSGASFHCLVSESSSL